MKISLVIFSQAAVHLTLVPPLPLPRLASPSSKFKPTHRRSRRCTLHRPNTHSSSQPRRGTLLGRQYLGPKTLLGARRSRHNLPREDAAHQKPITIRSGGTASGRERAIHKRTAATATAMMNLKCERLKQPPKGPQRRDCKSFPPITRE
jgi:hypothetical protein